jgi:hypothetical protein
MMNFANTVGGINFSADTFKVPLVTNKPKKETVGDRLVGRLRFALGISEEDAIKAQTVARFVEIGKPEKFKESKANGSFITVSRGGDQRTLIQIAAEWGGNSVVVHDSTLERLNRNVDTLSAEEIFIMKSLLGEPYVAKEPWTKNKVKLEELYGTKILYPDHKHKPHAYMAVNAPAIQKEPEIIGPTIRKVTLPDED